MSNTQAIVRRNITIAATFVNKPSEGHRTRLKNAGAEFKNGQWIKTVPVTTVCDSDEAAVKLFEGMK